MYPINTMLCPIKVNCNTIELTLHTAFYYAVDLLYVIINKINISFTFSKIIRKRQSSGKKGYSSKF